ncbi:DUF4338 domain-containing protein [candidate division KSB1 bacterium]|nr:DUF4338 domain-containing protein [candidate division KSB1 bacterium]
MEKEIRLRGKRIGASELQQIRDLLSTDGHLGRSHLSRQLCRLWDFRQANGAYREIACRDLLRQLEQRGLITLPAPLKKARQVGYRNRTFLPSFLDTSIVEGRLDHFSDLTVELVSRTPREQLYNSLIGAYHYLGYGQGTGEQLKYIISSAKRPLAAIGFSAAALRVACRDRFIAWDEQARQKNLHLIVNNHRFLILPWVHITNLASWILAQATRRLSADWQARYAHDLVLVETFVEKNRFHGTCYRAANWCGVGDTVGRGRNDRFSTTVLPIKQVFLYPLTRHFRERCHAR